uniref:Uncharacterized protein n=1 Tax=Romanomermis culicivorax TaxID=13658 RepID=A0A915KFA2_ROMCU
MQLDPQPTMCHSMQTKQPNPKSTPFGPDVIIVLLRAGAYSIKAEVRMGVTCQLLRRSPWYSLCSTTNRSLIRTDCETGIR